MTTPAASAIVRSRDEERRIGRTLETLRGQTVPVEIVVVDSGSSDRTVEIARDYCDLLIEMPAAEFTYGSALNTGAAASSAPIHVALSAHCPLPRRDWVERVLQHYERADVAGTAGAVALPGGRRLSSPFVQDAAHARAHPFWGFSNHASSWRADVWEQIRFDETLEASEDRQWSWRVLDAGWVLVFDPALWVDMSHRWRVGVRQIYRRNRREARAVGRFAPREYGVGDLLREWWSDLPDDRHAPALYRLDPRRTVGLIGRYAGLRDVRR